MQYILELMNLLVDTILINGFGWVLVLVAGVYIWYHLQILSNQIKYAKTLNFIYLEVKIDELNERSPLAMEQIFAALHAINTTIPWGEKFAGKFISTTSCELVSLGGRVSYIFKIQDRFRNLLESAIFAQYPKAEIVETEDYLKNLPKHFDPDTADYSFWGTQLNKRKDRAESCYPIRTYGGFEHTEQETIIDPLSSVLEVMSNLQPHELLVSQILFKPVSEDWKKKTEAILKKLRGNPTKHVAGTLEKILAFPIEILAALINILTPAGEATPVKPKKDEPPSLIQHLSEGQKEVITAVEHQLAKISYEVKIRLLYLAPKDKFNKGLRIPEIIGAYRNFDNPSINGLKPDVAKTWTDTSFKYIKFLEQPYRDQQSVTRKRKFLRAFKDRDHFKGSGKMYMNTEELASIFHFPQAPNVRVSQIERVQTVKSAPPSNLPIGEI